MWLGSSDGKQRRMATAYLLEKNVKIRTNEKDFAITVGYARWGCHRIFQY